MAAPVTSPEVGVSSVFVELGESLAKRLEREGALPPEDVLRLIPLVCDALTRFADAGAPKTSTLAHITIVDGAPRVEGLPFAGTPKSLVKEVAGLTYELLKGLPPPPSASSTDFIGLRPEMAKPILAALSEAGASDVATFARQLRALGRGATAHYQQAHGRTAAPMALSIPSVPTDRVGQIFGPYELTRRLGEGGMGEVYVGRHTRLGREVAIKVLRDELAALPDVVQRFFQEAKVVNDLKHPNIVEILDFVEEPGRVYLVMELLQGTTLAELDRTQGPLSIQRIANLLAQTCTALEAAHQRGVVHRDIKPDNLFVLAGDELKVLDFGIARRTSGPLQTQAGVVVGTPFYMAPEQAAGRAVDGRTDLYSVGVCLYELLTGESFSAVPTPRHLTRTAAFEPVPAPLADLVTALLAIDPALRPASAAATREVLEAITPGAETLPPNRRRSFFLRAGSLAVGLGFSVLIGLIGARWAFFPADTKARPPQVDPLPLAGEPPVDRPAPPALAPVNIASLGDAPVTNPPSRPAPSSTRPSKPPRKRVATQGPESPVAAPTSLKPRMAELRRRMTVLVQRFGESQLTTLERAAVAHALQNGEGEPTVETEGAIRDAEVALNAAERRLGRVDP
jgi:serine/threonine-protein kinase